MKNSIVTIYLKLNAFTEDKLAIGLLYAGENHVFFEWSDSKIKSAANFLKINPIQVINKEFKNLKKNLESDNNALIKDHLFINGHLNKLKEVDDGLISFSDPKPVAKSFDKAGFQKLFEKYIKGAKANKAEEKRPNFHAKVKETLKANPFFRKRADIDYSVSPSVISSIYKPHKVDFISVNSRVLTGFSLDFDQTIERIENKLYEYRALTEGFYDFSKRKGLKTGSYLAFYKDPGDNDAKRELLENVLQDNTLPFELKEGDKIEETGKLLEEKGYKKFSSFIGG